MVTDWKARAERAEANYAEDWRKQLTREVNALREWSQRVKAERDRAYAENAALREHIRGHCDHARAIGVGGLAGSIDSVLRAEYAEPRTKAFLAAMEALRSIDNGAVTRETDDGDVWYQVTIDADKWDAWRAAMKEAGE